MQIFQDDNGREWSIKINGPVVEDVRKRYGMDLVSWETPPFERLAADPELCGKLLWFLLEDQAIKAGVEPRDFAIGLSDSIGPALLALCEATNDFFPPSKRSLRRSLLEKSAAVEAKAGDLLLAKLDNPAILATLSKQMDAKIATALAQSSVNQPDTSGNESAIPSEAATPSLRAFG
jgi:hypothetical protein